MIAKLPRWVWWGGWILSFVAGFVNVIGLLGFQHQSVTHLTGTTSMLAADLAALDWPAALHLLAVIASFVGGCVASGILIQDSALQLGLRYGAALLIESLLLCAAAPLLSHGSTLGMYCASFACGLQNAMVSAYSGAVVRTTHISGMLTDLGIYLGHWLRGIAVDQRRLRLCLLVISGFFLGGVAGARAFRVFRYGSLFFPAAVTGVAATAYAFYRTRQARGRR